MYKVDTVSLEFKKKFRLWSRLCVYSYLSQNMYKHFSFYVLGSEYISPAYEKMGFDLCRDYLVTMGYPQEIREFEYDPSFPIRYGSKKIYFLPVYRHRRTLLML